MLDHLDDLDADFLAIWRIDLRDPATVMSAEAFFARAFRTFAYRGAMREELLAEQRNNEDNGGPAPRPSPPTATPSDGGGTRWVSPEQMLAIYDNPELERR